MDIVWIDGGLGNQMFQYALALKLMSLGREVKLDVTKYAQHPVHNDFELDRVFKLCVPYAASREIRRLGYLKANHWTEFLKKTPFKKKTVYSHESYAFDEKVLSLDGCYLEGYWQSEKYFLDIRDRMMDTYRFPELQKDWQKELAKRLRERCSVSVHVRRGDYLRFPRYQGICTPEYYHRAMGYFRERFPGQAEFYIFTNDFPWAREAFPQDDCHFVEGNTGTESFRDMQLMGLCRHHIIANSSFSWWGAWLDPDPLKIVIAPRRWVDDPTEDQSSIVPEGWMRMEG